MVQWSDSCEGICKEVLGEDGSYGMKGEWYFPRCLASNISIERALSITF